ITEDNKNFDHSDHLRLPIPPKYRETTIPVLEWLWFVYKGKWKEQDIAAKYVNRETSAELRDFDREHSNNVLILNGKALLADFGLSKSLLESKTKKSGVRGVQAYIDPALLNGRSNDKYKKSSDIYSFGVLIKARNRNSPAIYEDCWNPGQSLRPEISKILDDLKILSKEPTCTERDIHLTEISSSTNHLMENSYDIISQEDSPIDDSVELKNLNILDTLSILIEKACQIGNFYNSYDNMQLNKRMGKHLGECIIKTVSAVKTLENKTDYDEFLTLDNYKSFRNLLKNLENIRNFIEDISQIRRLKYYIQETDYGISFERLKDEYFKLLKEFGESTSSLGLDVQIDSKIDDINKDIEETKKFIQTFESNLEGDSMFNFVEKISAHIQNAANNEVFEYGIIQGPFDDKNAKSKKFKPPDMKLFSVRMTLLKNLKGLVNISKFYCAIKCDDQIEMTIEWSQYGNLRTYYKKHPLALDIQTKLKFALEICNALVFLNTVGFLHRDIKSENILITNELKAKITNFCESRLVTD
ncbi:17344_t:CDS:2, partial [Dentiscutata erythropus]